MGLLDVGAFHTISGTSTAAPYVGGCSTSDDKGAELVDVVAAAARLSGS